MVRHTFASGRDGFDSKCRGDSQDAICRFVDSDFQPCYVNFITHPAQVHVIDMSLSDGKAAAAVLHACVSTGFFYGMPQTTLGASLQLLTDLVGFSGEPWGAGASC